MKLSLKKASRAALLVASTLAATSAAHAQGSVIITNPGSAPVPPAGLSYNDVYSLVSVSSKLCLDVVDKGTENGSKFQVWGCNAAGNQKFLVTPLSAGVHKLTVAASVASGELKVISVKDSDKSNGAVVQQWDNIDVDNQQIVIEPVLGGAYNIKFKHSGKCLDVKNAGTTFGTSIQQWACSGSDNQKFVFVRMENLAN